MGPTGAAYDLSRQRARWEGILAGHSSGLALWGLDQLVQEGLRNGAVYGIFPDDGRAI